MEIALPKSGRYVIAVSGGLDSVVLLHILRSAKDIDLVVAHFDHGIRNESEQDRLLVQSFAKEYGLPFVYDRAELGPGTSEAEAREARYEFLRNTQKASGAQAIITAHHQDDVLETAIINLMRGTGRKGLTSLSSRSDVVRPLLNVSKDEIRDYAKSNKLDWNEDETNQDETYLRNYVRKQVLPRFDAKSRTKLLDIITGARTTNQELDDLLLNELKLQSGDGTIDRHWFNKLPHNVALEVLASWLRDKDIRSFDTKTLERLAVAAKTGRKGQKFPIKGNHYLEMGSDVIIVGHG